MIRLAEEPSSLRSLQLKCARKSEDFWQIYARNPARTRTPRFSKIRETSRNIYSGSRKACDHCVDPTQLHRRRDRFCRQTAALLGGCGARIPCSVFTEPPPRRSQVPRMGKNSPLTSNYAQGAAGFASLWLGAGGRRTYSKRSGNFPDFTLASVPSTAALRFETHPPRTGRS